MDQRIAELEHLKDDLQCLGTRFSASQQEADAGHTVFECSPETCTCLGAKEENPNRLQEVELWLNRPESKK